MNHQPLIAELRWWGDQLVGGKQEHAGLVRVLTEAAEALAATSRPPQELHRDCHDLVCNGSRNHPRGTVGVSCSCRGRDLRALESPAAPPPWQPIEADGSFSTELVTLMNEHRWQEATLICVVEISRLRGLPSAPASVQPSCLCPDCQIQMTPEYGPLAPGGPSGRSWVCPRCRIERMWPDPSPPASARVGSSRASERPAPQEEQP